MADAPTQQPQQSPLAALFPQGMPSQPQAAPVAAPTAAPAAQPQTGSPDVMSTLMGQYQTAAQKGGAATERSIALGRQIGQVPEAIPWKPSFRPMRGPGDFLHNLFQGILAVGAATRPGQAIEEVMDRPARMRRAQEIQGLEAAQQPEEKAAEFYGKQAEAAGRLGYEQGMLGVRQQQVDVNRKKVDAYVANMQERVRNDLVTNAQRWKGLDINQARQQAQQWYQQQQAQLRKYGIDTGLTETEMRVGAQESIANAIQSSGMVKEFPWLTELGRLVGSENIAPPAPQVPGGAQPVREQKPTPARPAAKPAAKAGAAPTNDKVRHLGSF